MSTIAYDCRRFVTRVPLKKGPQKATKVHNCRQLCAHCREWFQTGGFPDLDLSFLFGTFLSFLGLPRFLWDFPDLLGDGPGNFPIHPFSLSRPMKNTPEEQSRKGPRAIWTFPERSGKPPGLETPRFSFSQI